MTAVLIDFDLAHLLHTRTSTLQAGGSLHFVAPEVVDKGVSNPIQADIYSFWQVNCLCHYGALQFR